MFQSFKGRLLYKMSYMERNNEILRPIYNYLSCVCNMSWIVSSNTCVHLCSLFSMYVLSLLSFVTNYLQLAASYLFRTFNFCLVSVGTL